MCSGSVDQLFTRGLARAAFMSLVSPVKKVDQGLDFPAPPEFITKNFKCFNSRVIFSVEAPVGLLQAFDGFGSEPLAF